MRAQEFVAEDLTRRGFLRGLGAAAAAGATGGALAQAQPVDASKEFQNMRRDDPRVRHAQDINDLAKAIYQNMVAERGQPADRREQNKWMEIAHLKAEARFAQYKPGAQTATKPAAGFPSQGSEYRRARDIDNFEGVETKVGRRNETHDWAWYSMGKDGKWKYGGDVRTKQQAQAKAQEYSSKQGVAEAFDTPYKTKTEKSDYGDVDVLAKLPDGSPLSIMFNQEYDGEGNEVVQVEFYRNNSQEITGEGDAQRVFATVLAAMQKYIKKYKPQTLIFSASKEIDMDADYVEKFNPESRAKLYDRLVQRYAGAWGYQSQHNDEGNVVRYKLTKTIAEEQLDELSFLGSECTKDCSGHRAGYDWSKRKGLRQANSWSPSFNKGAGLAVAGK